MPAAEALLLDCVCQAFIERWFSAEAHRQALRQVLPDALLLRVDNNPLHSEERVWPECLQGNSRHALTLLASSRGLNHDGWLEQDNQLVIRINEPITALGIGLYLPTSGLIDGDAELELILSDGNGNQPLARQSLQLQRGVNKTVIRLPVLCLIVITFKPFYVYRPDSKDDRRLLLAVLSELISS
jgi:hypothetical protein